MNAIVVTDKQWAIGRSGDLLFSLPGDMKHFRTLTTDGTVIMGRKTLDSFPGGRPLPKRRNIVITRDPAFSRVRMTIQQGNLNLAEELLNAMSDHNAEWNFLKGVICYRKGWMDEAKRYYETAVQMAPNNPEYRRALDIMEGRGNTYRPQGYGNRTTGTFGSDECTKICGTLICVNCLCGGGRVFFC